MIKKWGRVGSALLFVLGISTAAFAQEASFYLGGELELEFVDTQKDESTTGDPKNNNGTGEEDPHFQIDVLYLYPKLKLNENVILSADLYFKADKTYIEEVWAKFSGSPHYLWLEAGLNDPFIANIDRKLESEILVETAFYRSDDLGVTVGGNYDSGLYWLSSFTNGFVLGKKGPSEDSGYPIIHDARNETNSTQDQLVVGFGAGFKKEIGASSKVDLLPFYYSGTLSSADMDFLKKLPDYDKFPADELEEDSKIRYGFNARYDVGSFTLIGQWLRASDGALDRDGWFVQPSVKAGIYEFVYRYNDLDVGITPVATDSLTWDRTQHIIGVVTTLYKGVKLKTEYALNEEATGGADVHNDEFSTQLEIVW